ncbi:uncharacterized protein LOC119561839 isoform X3 [Drosophila subpulchrella]|uniref:uncharacterized protein LOC119561839 isoform X3 n=1 Tax=Drosophila subpulchrella TaxID=1486046 RepID=UPI0018A19934|nr:uncharacterized protein LOC119561839 isoform X3 [Drosophila subpulchrella]
MSEDPTDLTPGHFLVGGPLLSIVEPEENGESKSIINQWQHLKALYHQFRARRKAFAPARFAKSPDACPSTAFIILDTSTVARGTSPASQRQPPPGCVGDRPDRGGDIRAPRRAPSMHPWPPFFSC